MPWKVYSENGKSCVHKINADDSKGDLVHCHDSEESAQAQVRALYASEQKELILNQAIDQIKGIMDSDREDIRETVQAILDEFLVRKSTEPMDVIDNTAQEVNDGAIGGGGCSEEQEKEKSDMRVVDKLKSMLDTVGSAMKSVFERKDNTSDIMLWKEGDGYRWIGRYSNNFRDDDNPPEIISADSHKKFVEKVDKGLVRLPELWIWHMKNLAIGISDWVLYDDAGFSVAGGHSLPGTNEIFETLSHVKGIAMSHGMLKDTIKRDPNDNTIIVEHETREISILPRWSAANKMTGFAVLSNSEEVTMIPSEKKERLAKEWGLSEAQISALEAMNAGDAEKAIEAGIERKENEVETAPAAAPGTAEPVAPIADVVEPSNASALTVEQVQETLRSTLTEALQPYVDKLNKLEADLKEIKTAEDARVVKAAAGTPLASLAALLGQTVQSAVGNPDTQVDGRTTLAKSKPAESTPAVSGKTLVPFINDMLAPKQQ